MPRTYLQNKLKELQSAIIEMGSHIESRIEDSIRAFKENDLELCRTIMANDQVIDNMEKKIESECLWLIAREHPVASDLRKITTILKITTDMERIGDHASDIAEVTMRVEDRNTFSDSIHIPQMAAAAIKMVNSAIKAYVNSDMELARATMEKDDEVDDFFNLIKEELVQVFKTQQDHMDSAIDFLMIAKYLERVADHAENICEWVIFSQTGEHKDIRIF